VVDDDPMDPADVFLYHKTTNRTPYDRRRERHPGVDDVILVNTHNEITESTIANVAVRLDGRWWTPPLDAGCLPGVFRAVLLDEGRLAERIITAAELERCEGLALISSVRLLRPAALAVTGRLNDAVPAEAP
jgi:para-aminobenzoate synthetase/4-amino-4-deoxychorismate lyase